MIKPQRRTTNRHLPVVTHSQVPLMRIPGSDIQARLTQDANATEQSRHQIHPALIGKQPIRHIIAIKSIAALAPPLGESPTLFIGGHANKAEIVGAIAQACEFIRHHATQRRLRRALMRREENGMVVQRRHYI